MVRIRVALVQKELKNDINSSIRDAKQILSKLSESDSLDLIVFPESWLVERLYDRAKEIIERYYEVIEVFEEEAARIGSYIVAGAFFKEDEGARFIVSPIISKNGELIAEQYKINLFRVEKNYFQTKPELYIFDIKGNKIGVEVCYDINFPEVSRELVLHGADLIINPSRIFSGGEDMWHLYIMARMLENRVPIIGVNVYHPTRFNGYSIAIEPQITDNEIVKPKKLIEMGRGEDIAIIDIDPEKNRELREKRIKEIKSIKKLATQLKVIYK